MGYLWTVLLLFNLIFLPHLTILVGRQCFHKCLSAHGGGGGWYVHPSPERDFRKDNVFTSVGLSIGVGIHVYPSLERYTPSAAIQWMQPKRAVCNLLESFIVINILSFFYQASLGKPLFVKQKIDLALRCHRSSKTLISH